MKDNRREILKKMGLVTTGVSFLGTPLILNSCNSATNSEQQASGSESDETPLFFSISLAQWSLHKSIFSDLSKIGWQEFGKRLQTDPDSLLTGPINPEDFPVIAKNKYGIPAIELVNTFYFSKKNNTQYWNDFKARCENEGVESLIIMCDAEGNLGDTDDQQRQQAVENHYGWIDAAALLGCHSIRVNAAGNGTAEEVKASAVDGLGKLVEYGENANVSVIVENHGGYSSDAAWLSGVISQVNSDFCGTLPDFGNFCIERSSDECTNEYDKYKGVRELMPFAKGVSAKTHEFDAQGNEVRTDFKKMLKIVKEAGFKGYIGIEYEGSQLSEDEGIKATKELLIKSGKQV